MRVYGLRWDDTKRETFHLALFADAKIGDEDYMRLCDLYQDEL